MKTQLSKALVLLAFLTAAAIAHPQEEVRTIEVHLKRFSFTPSEITLQKRETVKLVLISEDTTHSLLIPDLNVSQEVSKGHPAEVTIVANTVGDFHGMCGHYCGTDHGSMTFTVHVKDN